MIDVFTVCIFIHVYLKIPEEIIGTIRSMMAKNFLKLIREINSHYCNNVVKVLLAIAISQET